MAVGEYVEYSPTSGSRCPPTTHRAFAFPLLECEDHAARQGTRLRHKLLRRYRGDGPEVDVLLELVDHRRGHPSLFVGVEVLVCDLSAASTDIWALDGRVGARIADRRVLLHVVLTGARLQGPEEAVWVSAVELGRERIRHALREVRGVVGVSGSRVRGHECDHLVVGEADALAGQDRRQVVSL